MFEVYTPIVCTSNIVLIDARKDTSVNFTTYIIENLKFV